MHLTRRTRMASRSQLAADEPMAQTTIRFPQSLLKRARVRAATDELSLQALMNAALAAELERREVQDERRQARDIRRARRPR